MKSKYIFTLAIKNLTRHKRRTFITVLVLAIGIATFILLDSMLIGARRASEINLIRHEMGSAKLVTPEYWDEWRDFPLKSSVENPRDIIQALDDAGITAVPRIQINTTMVINSGIGGSLPSLLIGMDMQQDSKVFDTQGALSSGRLPQPGEEALLMGSWMATDLKLELGDIVFFQVVDRQGGNEVLEAEIVGLLDTPDPMVNRMGVYIPLDTLDYYLFMEESVTEIALSFPMGPGKRSARKNAENIAKDFGLELHTWQDWSQDYLAASEGDKYGSFIILVLVFIIAAVGFSNTLLMALLERVRETGMMRALGTTQAQLRRLFLTESLMQGLAGSLFGIFLGVLFNIPVVLKGIDYSSIMRDMSVGYRFTGIIYGVWASSSYIISMLSGVSIALAVSWFSIKKALKLKITDSIRGN
jgi:putative ABC transport system permease protein